MQIVRNVCLPHLAWLLFAPVAMAQSPSVYPSRPIRLLVPMAAGAGTDIGARILSTRLGEAIAQQVVVDNRAGASGIVGAELAARAAPDGYTLVFGTASTHIVGPFLVKNMPYDPVKDFTPISIAVNPVSGVVVSASVPARTVAELVSYAKANPGKIAYGSNGIGSSHHLVGELIKMVAGIDMLHVPFRGAGPALVDVMGGHTKVAFGSVTSSIAHIRSGKLRPLGVGGAKRSGALPEVPTVAEGGLPGYQAANWIGLVAPAGTPDAIVARLHQEIDRKSTRLNSSHT